MLPFYKHIFRVLKQNSGDWHYSFPILSIDPANAPNKKELLKARLATMLHKATVLTQKLKDIKQTETYTTATQHTDWDTYFETSKTNLQQQIEALKAE